MFLVGIKTVLLDERGGDAGVDQLIEQCRWKSYVIANSVVATNDGGNHEKKDVGDIDEEEIHSLQRVNGSIHQENNESRQTEQIEDNITRQRAALQNEITLTRNTADTRNKSKSDHSGTTGKSEISKYPMMEPTPISTLSPPWIVVIILMTISGAEAPNAIKDAPATSSFKFIFTHRISRLGTRNSSQIYSSELYRNDTDPNKTKEKKKINTSITTPHQWPSIASRHRPSNPDLHHYSLVIDCSYRGSIFFPQFTQVQFSIHIWVRRVADKNN